ncbi:MAG: shikimate dehydrogenase [Hyphomicrobiaceae bacterium]|nr:shikimate dehydrogenase [Hyphomicrobiaceae bacterium]
MAIVDTATAPWPRAACVLGYPARHSRSPKLHGYWIDKYGLDATYVAEEVAPDAIEAFIRGLAAHGYVGANVTMPHKDVAFALSEPDARARAVGAANTLWFEGGRLKSTNTDVEGFVGSLDAAAPGWADRTRRAVVLGAGGAARAVVFGLIERGVPRIQVVNRTVARAEELRARFGAAVEPASWAVLDELLAGADLLVNATSLGMHGNGPLDVDPSALVATAVVSDIVYVPLKTPLLAAADAIGLATANGLDMLLHQAVRGFELWFGVRPEVTREQYDLLARDIEGRN